MQQTYAEKKFGMELISDCDHGISNERGHSPFELSSLCVDLVATLMLVDEGLNQSSCEYCSHFAWRQTIKERRNGMETRVGKL